MTSYEVDIYVINSDERIVQQRNIIIEDVLPNQKIQVWVNDQLKFEDVVEEED